MLLKSVFLVAGATVGLCEAKCTFTGYSGSSCSGSAGTTHSLSTGDSHCYQMKGRKSFKLSSDCGTVRITSHTGQDYYCKNDWDSLNDLAAGCHSWNEDEYSATVLRRS